MQIIHSKDTVDIASTNMAEEDNDTREGHETSDDEDYKDVPEGGWGWFVVAGDNKPN